jgi:hypothetical protein
MTESTTAAETAAARSVPDQSLPARIFGVLLTPRATYASVAARPRVLGMLLFVLLFGAAAIFLFLSTEVGKNAMLDNQVEQMKSFGMNVTEQMIDRLEQGANRQRYFAVAGQMVALPLFAAIIAGLAFAVFNAIMGGDAAFKQVYAIVVHSGVVFSFSQLFTLPLSYAREKMSSATNLGVFAPFLDENSFAARALGSVDLIVMWWLLSLSIGLGVLYNKRTQPIATTLLIIYVVIGLIIAGVKTRLAGA